MKAAELQAVLNSLEHPEEVEVVVDDCNAAGCDGTDIVVGAAVIRGKITCLRLIRYKSMRKGDY